LGVLRSVTYCSPKPQNPLIEEYKFIISKILENGLILSSNKDATLGGQKIKDKKL